MSKPRKQSKLTIERLKELLDYSQETGVFVWLKKTSPSSHRIVVGEVLNSKHCDGYYAVTIDTEPHLLHRLAWFYVYGIWPAGEIDHKNGVRTDNRICNLRDVNTAINCQNQRGPHKNNSLGVLGVRATQNNTFRSQITKNGRCTYLGTHKTLELAKSAYINAKRDAHIGCLI